MPIRPDLRPFYRGPAWRATRERIRERAKDRCEQCGKPNGETVETITGAGAMCWRSVGGPWRDLAGRRARIHDVPIQLVVARVRPRTIRVVLTVAHLNHVSGDDRDENLKCLVSGAISTTTAHHHQTRATRKDTARPIKWEGKITV